MSRAAVLTALVLAGCSGAQVDGECGAVRCGEGRVCDLTDPAGPTCIDADGDLDGDGIPNNRDFCEHQPGGAFDEDRDGIGDDCDPCPIAPPGAEADPDGDAVDAPCDPDPETPGDTIAVFEGFNGAAIPANWRASSASWQVVGGAAVVTPTDPTVVEQLVAPLPTLTTRLAVLTGYRVDAVDATATQNIAGVIAIDRRPAGTSTVGCTGRRAGTTNVLVVDTDLGTDQRPFMTDLFASASLYELANKIEGAQAACAMVADNEAGAVSTASAGEAPSEAGLQARGATVRFGYLLVVQRP